MLQVSNPKYLVDLLQGVTVDQDITQVIWVNIYKEHIELAFFEEA